MLVYTIRGDIQINEVIQIIFISFRLYLLAKPDYPVSSICIILNSIGHIEDCQSAYWENFSTEKALSKVKTVILHAIDNKEVMCLVMLDLSATSNMVNHHLLLKRLKYRFGVCDLVLSRLWSYLISRTQSVIIQIVDGSIVESSKRPLLQGIPQGSVLGPILFNLCVTPLGELCWAHGVSFQGYADATYKYLSFRPISGSLSNQIECITRVENFLDVVCHWMQANLLKCNENKTEFIILWVP